MSRAHGEGTLYKLPTGRYRAQIMIRGQVLSKTGDQAACRAWLKTISRQVDEGLTYTASKTTLTQFLTAYLAALAADQRPKTHAQYEQLARQYILPALGARTLRTLTPAHIQAFYSGLLQDHSPSLVHKIHILLHKTLAHAVRLSILPRNPSSTGLVIVPRQPDREMQILTEPQVSVLLASVANTRYSALYHLAIATGARQNELLALRWTDLDWLTGELRIERQLARVKTAWTTAPLKTRYSRRTVILGPRTLELLRLHDALTSQARRLAGARWTDNPLIFPSTLGTPIYPRNLLRAFHAHLAAAGLPRIRFHDLRHTAAALMLNHNVPLIVASRRLGHSKPSTTLNLYGHLLPQAQRQAAHQIDELLTPLPLETIPAAPLHETKNL